MLNPSEKDREKQCFVILSLLSHNLTGKLIFSQKRVSKASNLIACCFWCVQMLILMLQNYTFDALLQGQNIQCVEIERHWSRGYIYRLKLSVKSRNIFAYYYFFKDKLLPHILLNFNPRILNMQRCFDTPWYNCTHDSVKP